jgi:hypothetical protein
MRRQFHCAPRKGVTDTTHGTAPAPAGIEAARAVADAVLYEGYLLYPYRKSSAKNRVRWQFGVLAPRAWIEARGPLDTGVAGSAESWFQQTECLMETPQDATVLVRLRFLQLQRKSLTQYTAEGDAGVDSLDVDGRRYVGFDEAVPQEFDVTATIRELLDGERAFLLEAPAGLDVTALTDRGGGDVGRVTRQRWPVSATVRLSVQPADAPFPLRRLRVRVENTVTAVDADAPREDALRHALVAAHCLIGLDAGAFHSLLEPPEWASAAAHDCTNIHTYPVLAGDPKRRDLLLSSPILLYDHPQVAPESAGDLHDSAEIDEILSLRTLTLTDAEKREARATDPRAAAIVDRVDNMPAEVFQRLHGAIRSLRPVAPHVGAADARTDDGFGQRPAPPPTRWWDPGADATVQPERDSVLFDGVPVARGSRVRLRPRHGGTDAHDMFLAGRTAHVEAVFLDVEGPRYVAVTLEDDPGADIHRWYGRFLYFSPEELQPLVDPAPKAGQPSAALEPPPGTVAESP